MGEYVWTSYQIGGAVPADAIEKLIELTDLTDGGDVFEAAKLGMPLCVGGEMNYGNNDELDEFLVEHGLTFKAVWSAAPGVFDAGIRYWRPGMEAVAEAEGNDEGEPTIGLHQLRETMKAGGSIADVIAELEKASSSQIPKLVIAATAPA